MKTEKNGHISWIVGVKGFCAVTVVALHIIACYYPESLMGASTISRLGITNITLTPLNILFNGSFSVYVFWMLSGFLLAIAYREGDKNLAKRFIRKYSKILVVIVPCLIATFIAIKLRMFYHEEISLYIGPGFFKSERDFYGLGFRDLLEDFFAHALWQPGIKLIPPLWTLQFDVKGSLLLSILLAVFGQKDNKKTVFLFAFVWILLFEVTYMNVFLCFLLGYMLEMINHRWIEKRTTQRCSVLGTASFLLGRFLGAYPPSCIPQEGVYKYVYTYLVNTYNSLLNKTNGVHFLYVIASFLILYGVISNGFLQKFFSNRVLLEFGKNSLYVYLVHILVIFTAGAWTFIQFYELTFNYNASVLVSVCCSVVIIALLSKVLGYLQKEYLNRWAEGFCQKIL